MIFKKWEHFLLPKAKQNREILKKFILNRNFKFSPDISDVPIGRCCKWAREGENRVAAGVFVLAFSY